MSAKLHLKFKAITECGRNVQDVAKATGDWDEWMAAEDADQHCKACDRAITPDYREPLRAT